MNNKNEYMCPICGEGTLCTDFTDGSKWGRAYCNRCDCGGPEVRTGYDENIDAPWRADARKQFVDVVNEHVIARPRTDPITGLVPCGCGGKAGFHYSVMMRDNDCYVECGICGVHTKVVLSEDKARDAWNTAMGWKGDAE